MNVSTGSSHLVFAKFKAELVTEDNNQFWRVFSLVTTLTKCKAPVSLYQNIDAKKCQRNQLGMSVKGLQFVDHGVGIYDRLEPVFV